MVNRLFRRELLSHPLARHSFVVFLGSMTTNVANYLFNLLTGRLLGPESYGVLTALLSLLMLVSVPASTLMTVVVKFTSEFRGRGENYLAHHFFKKLSSIFWLTGVVTTLVFVLLSPLVADYLKISLWLPVAVLGLSFLLVFPQAINNGFLQGWQIFRSFSFLGALGTLIKLFLGAGAAWVGWGVAGVLGGIFSSALVVYLLSFRVISSIKFHKETQRKLDWPKILRYSLPVLLTTLGLTLFITTDILVVKRFFSDYEAGIYASLALVGKVALWASMSVVQVMFALVAEKKARHQAENGYFLASLFLVALGCLGVTLVFGLFPEVTMRFFFGGQYVLAAPYLAFYCLFITLYSLINVFSSYFLSTGKVSTASLVLVGALLQIAGLGVFHSSFWEVIGVSSAVSLLLLLVMIGAYLFSNQQKAVVIEAGAGSLPG